MADSETEHFWKRTLKGSALSKALFSAPASWRTAEKKLSEFMDRVHRVNMDSRFLHRVQMVTVFGSFLTRAPSVGDLDLAVELVQKEADGKKHTEMVLARAREASRNGRRFHNFVERICFAAEEVRLTLKARSRIIQLTDCDDGVLKIAESRVIYEQTEAVLLRWLITFIANEMGHLEGDLESDFDKAAILDSAPAALACMEQCPGYRQT